MATGAVCNGKGNSPMTASTKLTVDNFDHRNGIAALFHHENSGVAITAIKPEGMRKMWEYNIRH